MALIDQNTYIKIEEVSNDLGGKTCSCVVNVYDYKHNLLWGNSHSWKGVDYFTSSEDIEGKNVLTCLYNKIKEESNLLWTYDETEETIYSMPKIYKYVRDGVKNKHFHDINYKKELTITLYPKRSFIKGELRTVIWYSDSECTDPILEVSISYVRDILGFASSRVTTRSWHNFDGTKNTESKVTGKDYTLNDLDKIEEGIVRRGNIVKGLQMPILTYMVGTISELTQPEIIQLGRDFLKLHKLEFQSFIEESHKQITTDITNVTDFWLDNVINAEGGTIRSFILEELDI